jgi:hypothetical protein
MYVHPQCFTFILKREVLADFRSGRYKLPVMPRKGGRQSVKKFRWMKLFEVSFKPRHYAPVVQDIRVQYLFKETVARD